MGRVIIVGCGVVGAAIAYELSLESGLQITVVDRQPPAQGATKAALGILMGVISRKHRGRAWQWRLQSLQRYETLIPELRSRTGLEIPFNRQGILQVLGPEDDLKVWERLMASRQNQGLSLEWLDRSQVQEHYPFLAVDNSPGAIYSPQDRQVHPTALTEALIAAATLQGVKFRFNISAQAWESTPSHVKAIRTSAGSLAGDWFVLAAGLGTTPLTTYLQSTTPIQPVLGQAAQVWLPSDLGHPQPVFSRDDVHLVPLSNQEYWVGATVEFPPTNPALESALPQANEESWQAMWQGAIALCPALKEATLVHQWSGLRPRPVGQPAPLVGPLPHYPNVLLATGHYRNGVFLAPATAQAVCQFIHG